MDRFTGVLGILAVLIVAWLGSTDRRRIRWRTEQPEIVLMNIRRYQSLLSVGISDEIYRKTIEEMLADAQTILERLRLASRVRT